MRGIGLSIVPAIDGIVSMPFDKLLLVFESDEMYRRRLLDVVDGAVMEVVMVSLAARITFVYGTVSRFIATEFCDDMDTEYWDGSMIPNWLLEVAEAEEWSSGTMKRDPKVRILIPEMISLYLLVFL